MAVASTTQTRRTKSARAAAGGSAGTSRKAAPKKVSTARALAARVTRAKLFGKGGSSVSAKPSALPVEEEMQGIIEAYAFGDIWSRPGLPLRIRSLITIGMLTALYRTDQLRAHINAALNIGVKPEQILETILHAGAYAGLPTGANGKAVAMQVFRKRGIVKE